MKKSTIIRLPLLLCMLVATVIGVVAAKPAPAIEFTQTEHDFGNIRESAGEVTHVFEFTNTGDAPLVIISATASCGCTRPQYTAEPVRPGEKGHISVTYVPTGRPGEFSKTVKVRTNVPSDKKLSLRISGVVVPQ